VCLYVCLDVCLLFVCVVSVFRCLCIVYAWVNRVCVSCVSHSSLTPRLETMLNPVVVIDAAGAIQFANTACSKMLGYTKKECGPDTHTHTHTNTHGHTEQTNSIHTASHLRTHMVYAHTEQTHKQHTPADAHTLPLRLVGANVRMLMNTSIADKHDAYISEYLRTGHAKIIGKARHLDADCVVYCVSCVCIWCVVCIVDLCVCVYADRVGRVAWWRRGARTAR
jgi:transcriptional regulator with PAS, ATPase and Fis domain